MYAMGAIPSPPDDRDYPIAMFTPVPREFPEKFILSPLPKVKNQGMIGSCVPHSLVYTREIKEGLMEFSIGFLYGNREETDIQTEGMIPRQALNSLRKYGDVPLEDFPWNIEYKMAKAEIERRKDELYEKAYPYRISAYFRLYTEDEIKAALIDLGAVSATFPVYESFSSAEKSGIVPVPQKDEKLKGYHQMTIVGWDEKNWIVLNSYGEKWGDKGMCYVPKEYPILEYWATTDTISDFEIINVDELIKRLNKYNHKELHVHHTWNPDHNTWKMKPDGLFWQQSMKNYHVKVNGWQDIGQHVTLLPDGKFVTGRDFGTDPASIKGYNEGAFSCEMFGNFDTDKFDGAQKESMLKLASCFHKREKYIRFHNENSDKSCPGTLIKKDEFMKEVVAMDNIYKDFDKVSNWAKEAVTELNKLSIMKGDANGNFKPKNNVTREELAQALYNFYKAIK